MMQSQTHTVGSSAHQDSAALHVQGKAFYIDDLPEPAGCLHCAPGYAPKSAKGRITKLDLDAVKAAAGVVAVLTASDIRGPNDCSPAGTHDDPILADTRIEFHGQPVFLVVATSHLAARRATRLAVIEVSDEKPNVAVCDGMVANDKVMPDYHWADDTAAPAIEAAAHKGRVELEIGGQEHFYLEGQIALALPQEQGGMHVVSSTQHTAEIQKSVAHMLELPSAAITAEVRRMGGAFGGKESQAVQWACLASLAARHTGQACKLRLDRDDDMRMTGKRHDFYVTADYGHDDKGVLDGVKIELNARCGVSADLSGGVVDRAMFHADNAYFYPTADILSRRVRTNTVSNTAFRGFGGPKGHLFAEHLMDRIAISLNEDPLTIRKRNLYRRGKDVTPYGMKVREAAEMKRIILQLEKDSDYQQRRREIAGYNKGSRWLKRGISLTPVKFGISFTLKHMNQAGALVHVYEDGSIMLNHGGTEMGQGLNVKVAQVVAEILGQPLEAIQITSTRTDKVPNSMPTAASAGSDLNGMAAKQAAEIIRKRMTKVAEDHLGKSYDQVPFAELAKACVWERVSLSATGYYATPEITWDRASATGNPFYYFSLGAACSEVVIDTLTGEMKVKRVDILHDVGKSLNPEIDLGQIEGGFVQGMGWLTTEELVYGADGQLKTHAPSTYKIPTAFDVPEHFKVGIWKSKGNHKPTIFRSKAVGEPPLMLAASVFSAITHAVASIEPGRMPDISAPATPEVILKAVNGMLNA